MRLSLMGMAGTGKSYWAARLAEQGFRCFCCDDLIAGKLAPELTKPDGTTMEMGQWMGFPFEPGYKERESKYQVYEKEVLAEILEHLKHPEENLDENIVIDTTGSVIYTGDEILRKLRKLTTVVYLLTPPGVQEQLLEAYISRPHPMLWRDVFKKERDETNQEALARCYPRLLSSRKQLYEKYADVTMDYYIRREKGFGVSDFLYYVENYLPEL